MKIESVHACGSHYTNRNFFRYLEENEITLGINVKKNSVLSIGNNRLRNIEVIRLQSKEDLLKWKMKRKYGNRWWIAETAAFSTIKRMFGESMYVSATLLQNMVSEMMIKVSLYNLFR